MDAHLTDWFFWGALAFALAVAFVVTWPINRWLMNRGRGHAVVHQHHDHQHHDQQHDQQQHHETEQVHH